MNETQGAPEGGAIEERVAAMQRELKGEGKTLLKLAGALAPLARERTYEDAKRCAKVLERVEKKALGIAGAEARASAALAMVREAYAHQLRALRESLARNLQQACLEAGLELRVLSREDPIELRIPPFGVLIDRDEGRADIQFAKLTILSCQAEADAIVKTHQKARMMLEAGFDAPRFFEACHKAWLTARAACEGEGPARVEILDFLPFLALQLQKPAFRVDPVAKNYRGYSRARFAYDVQRLRRARLLQKGSWRLNLGVATGTTASRKNRALWFEDEYGEGEFKLTLFFTRVEAET